RTGFFALFFILCFYSGFSQQLTRIAVIDMSRVYTEYFNDSQAVRQFRADSARVQDEVNRMQSELVTLGSRRADAIVQNNQSDVIRLEAEIIRKTEDLRIYYQAKTAELDAARRSLTDSSFMLEINNELRLLAESEGITTFFDLNDTPGIIWYSPIVDYTDRLISRLRSRRN
ncbi:MAG: OmpH family outer membrane protein, partial [Treponema sp.]|nr:OmpH family outer membrane protein [Treponema sp.]